MRNLLGRLEGMLLIALGLGMGTLVDSSLYWLYLNPKFTWLTAATALLLMATGVIVLLHPRECPNRTGMAVLALFALVAVLGFARASQPPSVAVPRPPAAFEGDSEETRVVLDDREYTKINTAELYLLSHAKGGMTDTPFVVRGFVKRTAELDASGHFMLLRLTVSCCLADAVAVGLRVRTDQVSELEDGQWLQVFGGLAPAPEDLPNPVPTIKSAILWVVHPRTVLHAHRINPIDVPEIPFIFQVRDEEPYAY